MAVITYKYRLELVDPSTAQSVQDGGNEPDGVTGDEFVSWKDIKLPVTIDHGIMRYWADGWETIRGVKLTDVKYVIRQTFCDGVLVIEEPIWEHKITYKYRFDLKDSSNGMFVPEDKEEPEGPDGDSGDFVSWKDIYLPVTINKEVIRYWADGWDTVRGVMLNNVNSIIRQTYCDGQVVIEEPVWNNG